MSKLYDKTGREIMVGDILKVFHFVGRRRKRHYMYKQVIRETTLGRNNTPYFYVSHLNMKPETDNDAGYHLHRNDHALHHVEIVQGYRGGVHFEDRPRIEVPNE